ncbi:MAG: DNRLRE domain-containing protein [Desulfatitalea sp.]
MFQRLSGGAYNYSAPVWTGSATTCTIQNLLEGTTYYFVARAYQGTTVSGNSNEVSFSQNISVPADSDRDGYSVSQGDCNDANASIRPNATEICGDGIDQNCNGSDLICPNNIDNDNDGSTENQGDCNDANASIHPGANEICGDGIDQNCNGNDLACADDSESVTLVFGNAPDADYPGTAQDTFLNINADVNISQNQLNTYTWPLNRPANAALIKFNLSRLPADARITSAILTLYQTSAGGDAAYDVSAHKVIHHNPNLSTANGLTYNGVNNWTANTGCYNGVPMAQADIAPAEYVNRLDRTLGYKNWDISDMVQDWVSNAASNYGVLLNADAVAAANSFRYFASSEASNAAQRPILEITYTRPVIKTAVFGNAPDADYPGTVQDTFLNINTEVNISRGQLNTYTWPQNRPANAALIKFDLSRLPAGARIESAILTLYQTGAGGDAAYDVSVHQVIHHNPNLSTANGATYDGVHSWTANTICYNGTPLAQADIAPAEDVNRLNATLGYKTWDVTDMVEKWAINSATNFGLMLNSDAVASANSYRFFASSEASAANTRPSLIITYSN